MKKDEHSHSFTSAFRKFLVNEKLDKKYREKLLVESWGVIMGHTIASRTSSVYIKDKILFIKLTSAALKQEMNNHKPKILALLVEDFGDLIDDVRVM